MPITRWYFQKQGLHINVSPERELVTIPVTGAYLNDIIKQGRYCTFSGVSTTRLAPRLVAIPQPKQ